MSCVHGEERDAGRSVKKRKGDPKMPGTSPHLLASELWPLAPSENPLSAPLVWRSSFLLTDAMQLGAEVWDNIHTPD